MLTISRICVMKKIRVIPYKNPLRCPFYVIVALKTPKNRYLAGCLLRSLTSQLTVLFDLPVPGHQ